jgi:lambda family phage portal protein
VAKAARVAQKPAKRGRASSGRRSTVKSARSAPRRVRIVASGSATGGRSLSAGRQPQRMVSVPEGVLSNLQLAWRNKLVHGKYDAAQTTHENSRHWSMADTLGPDSASSADVRRILRMRSRHECANNCYAGGAVQTLANDIVGTGPRLSVKIEDREAARRIEAAFARWFRAARMSAKLQTMVKARVRDGEALGLLVNNPSLRSEVLLDVRLVEADLLCSPNGMQDGPLFVDGIEYDEAWNPVRYHMLSEHPGEAMGQPKSVPYDASKVLHTYREDRPGQSRGIPELTAALPLFALIRSVTLATVRANEHAASFAAVMQTTLQTVEAAELYGDETMDIERGTISAIPEGWELKQLEAKHPNSTYVDFVRAILNEVGRVLQMPLNIMLGNSSGYNYSSGRLDHQMYRRNIAVYRADLERTILDEVLYAWLEEAKLLGLVPPQLHDLLDLPHVWLWPGFFHVDPNKEADAQAQRLQNTTTTLADELAAGENPRSLDEVLEARAYELKRMKKLGIPWVNEFGVKVENDKASTGGDGEQPAASEEETPANAA